MVGTSIPPMSEEVTRTFNEILDEQESCVILVCKPSTLKQSRHTGVLYGKPAPKYMKLGKRKIGYRRKTLMAWVGQFPEISNTSCVNS